MHRVLFAAIALALAACSGSGASVAPVRCDASTPCPSGLYCQAQVCVPPDEVVCLQQVASCPPGYVCGASNTCVVAPPPLQVAIASPSAPVATNGTVHVVVSVTNGTPSAVYLLVDGAWLGAVPAGTYAWNTASTAEGVHALVAVATRGAESFQSAPVSVTVDRTGPSIASSTPANGASDVAASTPVSLVLSEPVRPATVAGAVTVSSGGSVLASTATLRADGRTVDVAFTPPAARPVDVTVAVGASLLDLLGNAAAGSSVSFTYPAWIPLGGLLYETSSSGGITDLAVDSAARPVLVLTDTATGAGVVRASRWEAGAWNALGDGVSAAGHDAGGGTVVVDASDRPVIAYGEDRYFVRVKRWDGSAWVALGDSLSPGTSSIGSPRVALMPDGEPVVAYDGYEDSATHARIHVKRWDATTGAWVALGGAVNPDLTTDATDASIVVDPSGRPVVAYAQWGQSGAPFQVFAARWENGAWTALGGNVAPDPTVNALYTAAAVDGTGAPLVAIGNGTNGWVLRWDGAAWTPLGGAVSPVAAYGPVRVDPAVDATGRILAAFGPNAASANRFYVSALAAGQWSEIAPTPSTPGWLPWSIRLALDPAGVAVIGFCEQLIVSPGPPAVTDTRCYVRREPR